MKNITGKVVEVYIPNQYKNGNLLDIMDRTNIGFKVMTDRGLREVEVDQNEENAKIMKNDMVEIIEKTVSSKDIYDIRLCGGEDNE